MRGYAILLVLFVHAGHGQLVIRSLDHFDPTPVFDMTLPRWLAAVAAEAGNGVQLFFVVSAASLTLSLLSRPQIDLRAYALRRYLRIAPMFYVGVVAYLLLYGFGPRIWAPNGIGWGDVAATLLLVHVWFSNALNSVVPGGWSIGDEAGFYLLLPALFLLLRRSRRAFVVMAVLAFAVVQARYAVEMRNGTWSPYKTLAFPNQAPVFLVGMIAAWAFRFHPARPLVNSQFAGPALLAFMALVLPQLRIPDQIVQSHLLFALCAGPLCYVLSGDRSFLFCNRAIVSLGRVSFSVYLIHFALLAPMYAFAGLFVASRGVAFLAIYYGALVVVCYALARVAYRYVEEPFIRLAAGRPDPFGVWRSLFRFEAAAARPSPTPDGPA